MAEISSKAVADRLLNKDLNEDYAFIDGDTLASTSEVDQYGNPLKFRMKGIDAPEITKVFGADNVALGTAGSDRANEALMQLAKKEGFTNVFRTGKFDPNGRELIDLQDDKGRSWEQTLVRTGVLNPTRYSSEGAIRSYKAAQALGTDGLGENYDLARNVIAEAIADETKYEQRFRQKAIDETQLAYTGGLYASNNVMFRDRSRDFENKAMSPFSTAWDIGLTGAIEGLYGAVELIGETSGWDWAKNVGEAGIYRAREKLQKNPEVVTSYKDIDGFFGKEGFLQYVANNGAISLPYMAATIAGAVAAPYVGASALGVAATGAVLSPVALYTGTIWNDQEGDNKNAYLAVAGGVSQSVLDRLGLKFLNPSALLTKEGREQAITAMTNNTGEAGRLMQAKNMALFGREITDPAVAKKMLLTLSRQEVAKYADDAARFAKNQITARNVARNQLTRIAKAGAGEGITEALQEAIGYTAAHTANGFRDWDANEFKDRLIDATIAGTSLGGAISIPGGVYDYGAWVDVAYRTGPDTGRQTSDMGRLAQQDIEANGQQYNVQQENARVKAATDNINQRVEALQQRLSNRRLSRRDRQQAESELAELGGVDLNDRADAHVAAKQDRAVGQIAKDWWKGIPGLWRGMTRFMFDNQGGIQQDSVTARILGESVGSNLQRSVSGETYENRKHNLISEIKYKLGDVSDLLAAFGRTDKRKSRLEFSEQYYEVFEAARERAGRENRDINWDIDLPENLQPFANAFRNFHNKLIETGDRLHNMQAVHNPELGYVNDYLSRYKSLDKLAIENNRAEFELALTNIMNEEGQQVLTPQAAKELTDQILQIDGADVPSNFTLDGGFSVTDRSTFRPQSHRGRTLNLSDRAEFKQFMERDIFTNVSNAAKSAVRYTVLEEYVGSNNAKLNYRLNKIEEELIESGKYTVDEARARVNKLAFDLKNYFDAESGNYKRNIPPILRHAQKNILFVTTITGLPLATLSNFVELGLTSVGLTQKQIFGEKGSINSIARSFADEFGNTANRLYGTIANQPAPHKRGRFGHAILKKLGFFDWEVGAAHTTGVSETGRWHQRILDMYFKTILLQQWTNAARAARAAIALDYISDKVAIMVAARQADITTNESREAEEGLRNLGLDTQFLLRYHTGFVRDEQTVLPNQDVRQQWERMINDATFNFINEAVALPQSANRPLIFQDPRFALFTQFQGFIATFTANHIPKMYTQLAKRGTPAMKYNIFATVSTMILLGFVSQHLKDLLKYGETTPYFKGMEYIRRGVGASGLLGTSERVIDFVFPMYDKRYGSNVEWFFGTIASESAGVSKALRIGDITADVITGEKPPETIVKITPIAQVAYQQIDKQAYKWGFGE